MKTPAASAQPLVTRTSPHPQASAQVEIIEQQKSRIRDLEASVRGLEGRCTDLRDAVAGHDQRTKDAQAEVLKGNQIIEKLMVGGCVS